MKIGELAKQCQVSLDTVRYYEKQGLLASYDRSEGGYRLFDKGAIERLRFIKKAKALGFTLKEIQELLDIKVRPEDFECSEVKALTNQKLAMVEAKIKELLNIQDALMRVSDRCCGGSEPATDCSILDFLSQDSSLN
jgi:MerR family Zn(II)-responsive transcriptional regulator of zntA